MSTTPQTEVKKWEMPMLTRGPRGTGFTFTPCCRRQIVLTVADQKNWKASCWVATRSCKGCGRKFDVFPGGEETAIFKLTR